MTYIFLWIFLILGMVILIFNKQMAAYQMYQLELFAKFCDVEKKGALKVSKSKALTIYFRVVDITIGLMVIGSMGYSLFL